MPQIHPARPRRFHALSLMLMVVALLGAPVEAQQPPAESESYLSELLNEPRHARAWRAMLQDQRDLGDWLADYARTRNGPTAALDDVLIEGRHHRGHMVCKTHDCGAHRFFVVFAPDTAQAWGLLLRTGREDRFFGQPDDAMQSALRTLARR